MNRSVIRGDGVWLEVAREPRGLFLRLPPVIASRPVCATSDPRASPGALCEGSEGAARAPPAGRTDGLTAGADHASPRPRCGRPWISGCRLMASSTQSQKQKGEHPWGPTADRWETEARENFLPKGWSAQEVYITQSSLPYTCRFILCIVFSTVPSSCPHGFITYSTLIRMH